MVTQAPSGLLWFVLLRTFSFQEFRHYPWRNAMAALAVVFGVALGFAVHLINASALAEFSSAARSAGGQPDFQLHSSAPSGIDESLFAHVLRHPDVAVASAVLELSTYASRSASNNQVITELPSRQLLKIVGVDALQIAEVAPDLMPRLTPGTDRLTLFAPDALFLNASARFMLRGGSIQVQHGLQWKQLRVAGEVRAAGPPLAVMDLGAMQDAFARVGQMSRVDIRLHAGVDKARFAQEIQALPDWPAVAKLREPDESVHSIENLSRAYRVNLTALALMALFTGGFLVFSIANLSVARRIQQFALLGVLGMTGTQRATLVLAEAACMGGVASLLGLLLGSGLAAIGLEVIGGDLGSGLFRGAAPALQVSPFAAAAFGAMGMLCTLAGAWWPARKVQGIPVAQVLKGQATQSQPSYGFTLGVALLLVSGLLALLPPVKGLALAAYLSIAMLLLGGVVLMPVGLQRLLQWVAPMVQQYAIPMLAIERARRMPINSTATISGVVAALSLAVALTVMVASFRTSVTHWLDSMLPAELYVRTAAQAVAQDTAFLDPDFVNAAARVPGVARIQSQRNIRLVLDPAYPAITLVSRPLVDPHRKTLSLPLVGPALPVPAGHIGIYVSEAVVDLYDIKPGADFSLLRQAMAPQDDTAAAKPWFVAGVWRDYARQFGTVAIEQSDFQSMRSDVRVNEMALWLDKGTRLHDVEQSLKALTQMNTDTKAHPTVLEFASAAELRAMSLQIFDRSFAVTYWLQTVAIGIGLFGVAANFGAQVIARRKEFGLLQHIGCTHHQLLRLVGAEGVVCTTLGAAMGVALGLGVAYVLVHVVNPQSFHWTMEMHVPWLRIFMLALAVIIAGTITATLASLAATRNNAVTALKEDW